jgi:hypothetical protein
VEPWHTFGGKLTGGWHERRCGHHRMGLWLRDYWPMQASKQIYRKHSHRASSSSGKHHWRRLLRRIWQTNVMMTMSLMVMMIVGMMDMGTGLGLLRIAMTMSGEEVESGNSEWLKMDNSHDEGGGR